MRLKLRGQSVLRDKQRTKSRSRKVKSSHLKRLILISIRLGSLSWGGFVAQIPLVERLLCTGEDALDVQEVRGWEHSAIVLPGPSYVNFVAIAGYELAGILGAFLLPIILLIPGSVLVCIILVLSTIDTNVQRLAMGVDSLSVFVISAGLVGGALRFLQRGTGSKLYAIGALAFIGLVYVGINPGLSLGAIVLGSVLVKSGGSKILSARRLPFMRLNARADGLLLEED